MQVLCIGQQRTLKCALARGNSHVSVQTPTMQTSAIDRLSTFDMGIVAEDHFLSAVPVRGSESGELRFF